MANILILAEKPDVARDIADAMIPGHKKEKEYMWGNVNGDVWVVTSAFGHLLALLDPEDYNSVYSKWNLEDLPIYFNDWKLKPAREEYKVRRLKLIGKLIAKTDMVICAGDPDDEGQLLIDEILDYFDYKGQTKRVFINDSMPENIRKEFAEMKENEEFRPLGRAASARRMADYCFGINESRLAGIRLKRRKLAVGRVQTPTLGLVIARDEQIENHVKAKFYEMELEVQTAEFNTPVGFKFKADKKYLADSGDDKHVTDRDLLIQIGEKLKNTQVNFKTVEKDKITNPSLPYNLTALQTDMNRRFGFSAKRTLDVTQSLRSKKAITYNRSDSQYLKEEHFQDAPALFSTILDGTLRDKYNLDFSRHSSCFNDSLVTAHHGIIPQKNNIDINKLTEDERKVYMAIVERYAMQFMPPLVQKVSLSTFPAEHEGFKHIFEHTAYKTIDPGYTRYFGKDKNKEQDQDKEEEENENAYFEPGKHSGEAKDYNIEEKETKPPARYTEGSLIKDMASIAKYVDDPYIKDILKQKDEGKKGENGGIGTVATRSAIIEGLLKRKFLEHQGKSIVSTQLGREFYSILPPTISKPDTTARWWLIQEAIKDGTETDPNAIQKAVIEEFMKHKDTAYQDAKVNSFADKPKASGTWKGQEISINAVWGIHNFTQEELDALFAGEKISFEYKGKTISGMLAEQTFKGRQYIGFKADEKEKKEGYVQGIYKKQNVSFKDSFSGHRFTEEEIKQLLEGKSITINALKKNGQPWEVSGKLAKQIFRGTSYFGFKPELTDQKKSSQGQSKKNTKQ